MDETKINMRKALGCIEYYILHGDIGALGHAHSWISQCKVRFKDLEVLQDNIMKVIRELSSLDLNEEPKKLTTDLCKCKGSEVCGTCEIKIEGLPTQKQ